jgi:hypothetical protein
VEGPCRADARQRRRALKQSLIRISARAWTLDDKLDLLARSQLGDQNTWTTRHQVHTAVQERFYGI